MVVMASRWEGVRDDRRAGSAEGSCGRLGGSWVGAAGRAGVLPPSLLFPGALLTQDVPHGPKLQSGHPREPGAAPGTLQEPGSSWVGAGQAPRTVLCRNPSYRTSPTWPTALQSSSTGEAGSLASPGFHRRFPAPQASWSAGASAGC